MRRKTNAEIFKNGAYHNRPPFSQLRDGLGQFGLMKKFIFQRTPAAIPQNDIPVQPITLHNLEHQRNTLQTHLYRLGHSTILMKLGADYWLTDPVFSTRVSPSQMIGPKRFHHPPLSVDDLPHLKGVVISHNHYDHLDKATIKRLIGKVEHFITPLGVAKYLRQWGVPPDHITELGWWQSKTSGDVTITATPTQHFSGRGLWDANKTLWASFVFQHKGKSVFFGSDSGYFEGFKQIGREFGAFDVTMLETGAYSSAWPQVHMKPEQTIQAHKDLGGKALMPIHNATFKLAFHPWKEPLERIARLAANENLPLLTPQIGERVELGQSIAANHWWANTH